MDRLAGSQARLQAQSSVDGVTPLVGRRLRVTGLVQGVGFRPHVWRQATALGLNGWVLNAPDGVTIEVEGPAAAVDAFTVGLRQRPPRLARIATLEAVEVPPSGSRGFVILASQDDGARTTLVSPDIAACPACCREFTDPGDRRFGYPFTNCTDCGPRYTIIRGLPYDRPLTSMRVFPMCPECQLEYDDPSDRRFHAQPNACPACGPRVWLETCDGREVEAGEGTSWPRVFRRLIGEGAIIAVKGLGGFHLACDAHSEDAVARLRTRKRRPSKPFAVMVKDIAAARRYVDIGPAAEDLLLSPAAPIVILPLRSAAGESGAAPPGEPGAMAPSLAPGSPSVGVMLAYTPLHLMLFDDEVDLLVMTSGNRSDEPIVRDNGQVRSELGGLADYFLFHDRGIVNRCEDSVVRVAGPVAPSGEATGSKPGPGPAAVVIPFRRSRGYVPAPIEVRASLPALSPMPAETACVLAGGGEMKSVFGILRGGEVFLSPHLGEMGLAENLEAYRETYYRYRDFLGARPVVAAIDPHPGYLVSRLATRLVAEEAADAGAAAGVSTTLPVYHHHAHMISCLADNGRPGAEETLAIVCDGTGYGPDGAVWGGEILAGNAAAFRRVGHLAYASLSGGDIVARRPYRSAAMHLFAGLGGEGVRRLARLRPEQAPELETCLVQLEGGAGGLVPTSSAGRLFDAIAALAGLLVENTYEGEAATLLGELAGAPGVGPGGSAAEEALPAGLSERYHFALLPGDPLVIDPGPFFAAVLDDLEAGTGEAASPGGLARRFHLTLARALIEATVTIGRRTGLQSVALSGGTFQNPYLLHLLQLGLGSHGFTVLTHRQVPPNDGGLALGQAVAAAWMVPSKVEGS